MAKVVRIPLLANLSRGLLAGCAIFLLASVPANAQSLPRVIPQPQAAAAPQTLTYVDLVELGMASDLVLRATIKNQANVRPDRAPGLAAGHVRLYLEAETQALLAGSGPVGESLAFLTDLPLDERGRRPKLKKQEFLLFARRVEGRPGEIQLTGPGAMQPVDPQLEARLRAVLTQLVQPNRPARVTGVREVMSVPGNLAGESETQIFLNTGNNAPVAITVLRRPGMMPTWGASWTDIVDQAARPPQPETLQWYTLACSLPAELPSDAFIQRDSESRARARADYALVRDQLGACARSQGG